MYNYCRSLRACLHQASTLTLLQLCNDTKNSVLIIDRRSGEGNDFTRVCLSTGGGFPTCINCHMIGGLPLEGGGLPFDGGGLHLG